MVVIKILSFWIFVLTLNQAYSTVDFFRTAECSYAYYASSAVLSSPSYAELNNVLRNEKCEWRITAALDERIVLNITDLDTDKSPGCSTNYIEVRDGYWYNSPLLGRYCGTGHLPLIWSTANKMLISYVVENGIRRRGFIGSYESLCGGNLFVDNQTNLESPNYPQWYPANKKCVWNIFVPENAKVALKFQTFDLEPQESCLYDYVEVRNGWTLDLIGVYCGRQIPSEIISNSSRLVVTFVSDVSVQRWGFSADAMAEYDECATGNHQCAQECINTVGGYRCGCRTGFELNTDGKNCDRACGGLLYGSWGTITSPSFPNVYPPNKTCIWEIDVPPQHRIIFSFTHLDLEGENMNETEKPNCFHDRIKIHRKNETELIGLYCGSAIPSPLVSVSDGVVIVFSSDLSIQKTGFSLDYAVDGPDKCAINNGNCLHGCVNTLESHNCLCQNGSSILVNGSDCTDGNCNYEISSLSGNISSPNYPNTYPTLKNCSWRFTTTPGHRIRLSFSFFELEISNLCQYDNVILFNGPSSESEVIGKYCNSAVPPPITSSNNSLYVTFKSDSSNVRRGFQANYSMICGGILQATTEENYIYSHTTFGSLDYENGVNCEWNIQASPGRNVSLTFLTFNLESSLNCLYDYVAIYDGTNLTESSSNKYCGQSIPTTTISPSSALSIRFHTDGSVVNKGFSIMYKAI